MYVNIHKGPDPEVKGSPNNLETGFSPKSRSVEQTVHFTLALLSMEEPCKGKCL